MARLGGDKTWNEAGWGSHGNYIILLCQWGLNFVEEIKYIYNKVASIHIFISIQNIP